MLEQYHESHWMMQLLSPGKVQSVQYPAMNTVCETVFIGEIQCFLWQRGVDFSLAFIMGATSPPAVCPYPLIQPIGVSPEIVPLWQLVYQIFTVMVKVMNTQLSLWSGHGWVGFRNKNNLVRFRKTVISTHIVKVLFSLFTQDLFYKKLHKSEMQSPPT